MVYHGHVENGVVVLDEDHFEPASRREDLDARRTADQYDHRVVSSWCLFGETKTGSAPEELPLHGAERS